MSISRRAAAIATTTAAICIAITTLALCFHLFYAVFRVSLLESLAAALATVGATAFAIYPLRRSSDAPAPVRAMGLALAPIWLAVAFALILTSVAFGFNAVRAAGSLIRVGQVVAASIPFLAVASAAAFAFAFAASQKPDAAGATNAKRLALVYAANGAKFVVVFVASLVAVGFGLSRGLDPALSAVLGIAFVACLALFYSNLLRAVKKGKSPDAKAGLEPSFPQG